VKRCSSFIAMYPIPIHIYYNRYLILNNIYTNIIFFFVQGPHLKLWASKRLNPGLRVIIKNDSREKRKPLLYVDQQNSTARNRHHTLRRRPRRSIIKIYLIACRAGSPPPHDVLTSLIRIVAVNKHNIHTLNTCSANYNI